MSSSPPPPERGPSDEPRGSRIAAARARAESAKTVLLVSALLAFFGAMLAERGTASSQANRSTPASASSSFDDSDSFGFDPGGIAPSQGAPSTSTGTS